MFVLYSFETGHPVLAACTALSNASWLAPGTRAFTSSWLDVMAKPSGCFSSVMVHAVSMLSGVNPACVNCAERAMEKQPACAAANSSSGLVPCSFSKRVRKE